MTKDIDTEAEFFARGKRLAALGGRAPDMQGESRRRPEPNSQ